MNRNDHHFHDLHLTLDIISSSLHRQGIGVTRKSAEVIQLEEGNFLWEKGILGTSSPRDLQHTIFYYVGLQFVLHGIQDLQIHQLTHFPT